MSENQKTIGVIGAGAWGTALAQAFSSGGRNVTIWAREPEVVKAINEDHENTIFLKGYKLDESLQAVENIRDVAVADILLVVTPAQYVRATLSEIRPNLLEHQAIVICSKGIELDSGLLLSEVAAQVLGPDRAIAILTGPTFASEIVQGLPGAVTIGTNNAKFGRDLQKDLGVKKFRPYVSDDIIGVQLGGAIKNVIAIACGIVTGKQMGESARAALLTRGIAEIARLAVALGGKEETLLGMCGVGDLVLTCSSMKSRNFSLGMALGEGKTLEEVLGSRNSVTEGVYTAQSTLELAKKLNISMPITEAVCEALSGRITVDNAIEDMLNRPFKYEMIQS